MATTTFNAAEMEARRILLRQELAELEDAKMKAIGGLQVIDYHHPERSPGWPIYNVNDPRNKYPRLLYHPTQKDERIEAQRLGVRRRNEANPQLAPMDIPSSECLTKKVFSEAEHAEALERGFVERPPETKPSIDSNSPVEAIGRAAENPLLGNNPSAELSVETIIKLNQMPKDELVKHARETFGVSLPEDASKVDIITAIQNAVPVAA